MGTNYYWYEKPTCACCGRDFEAVHIGKCSAGWCFSLHVIPEEEINDLEDWEKLWDKPESVIKNEYGDKITPAEMKIIITERSYYGDKKGFDYQSNYAEPGPINLVRHKIGYGCIKHGMGTWDCIVGEFS